MTTLNEALQRLLDREARRANTQGVVLRVQSGDRRIDFEGAAGAATPKARFCVASISKMFTATLAMQVVGEGRVTLDTPVQALLPDHDLTNLHDVAGARHGPAVTLRQLVHQTSGLADYYENMVAPALIRSADRAYGLGDVLDMARSLAPVAAPDSGRAHYSDTNYQLLGAAVSTVTGRSFAQDVAARISAPLGLAETDVAEVASFEGPRAPLPIHHETRRLHIPRILSSMGPDGGVISTPDELLRFLRAHLSGALFGPDQAALMRDWKPLRFPLNYGFGLMRFKLPRWMSPLSKPPELIGHSGASGAFAYHAPEPDIYLTGTFNQTDAPKRPFGFMLRVLRTIARDGGL